MIIRVPEGILDRDPRDAPTFKAALAKDQTADSSAGGLAGRTDASSVNSQWWSVTGLVDTGSGRELVDRSES